jgi:hypothetical protein
MRYCITLRSSPGGRITGWYDGSEPCWSTDRSRRKLFENERDAKPVCRELRREWPRNALVINIETERPSVPAEGSATSRSSNTVGPS